MEVFLLTLDKMLYLFLIILIGFIVARTKKLPQNAETVLSKLESMVFIPAMLLCNFSENFTVGALSSLWKFFALGILMVFILMPIATFISHITSHDDYMRKIINYSIVCSNFGFMGIALFSSLYPDLLAKYVVFIIPFWIYIYVWATPVLLIPTGDKGIKSKLKNLVNPMFITLVIGMLIGLIGIKLPSFILTSANALQACMSPVAMLITGITIAKINIKNAIKNKTTYIISFIRLILLPLIFIGIVSIFEIPYEISLCIMCVLAMPCGLNTIVIPGAYGKDTTLASSMALVSHLFACITLPLMLMLFEAVI